MWSGLHRTHMGHSQFSALTLTTAEVTTRVWALGRRQVNPQDMDRSHSPATQGQGFLRAEVSLAGHSVGPTPWVQAHLLCSPGCTWVPCHSLALGPLTCHRGQTRHRWGRSTDTWGLLVVQEQITGREGAPEARYPPPLGQPPESVKFTPESLKFQERLTGSGCSGTEPLHTGFHMGKTLESAQPARPRELSRHLETGPSALELTSWVLTPARDCPAPPQSLPATLPVKLRVRGP